MNASRLVYFLFCWVSSKTHGVGFWQDHIMPHMNMFCLETGTYEARMESLYFTQ